MRVRVFTFASLFSLCFSAPVFALDLVPQSRLNELSKIWPKYVSRDSLPLLTVFILLLALCLFLVIAWKVWLRWRHPEKYPSPLITFVRLALSMQLSANDCWLLYRIARRQRLPSPITLLLSPSTLAFHAQAYRQSLRRSRQLRFDAHCQHIAAVVFE